MPKPLHTYITENLPGESSSTREVPKLYVSWERLCALQPSSAILHTCDCSYERRYLPPQPFAVAAHNVTLGAQVNIYSSHDILESIFTHPSRYSTIFSSQYLLISSWDDRGKPPRHDHSSISPSLWEIQKSSSKLGLVPPFLKLSLSQSSTPWKFSLFFFNRA